MSSSQSISLTKKQKEALDYLNSSECIQVLYGGGARSGKSWLGCLWIVLNCLSKEQSAYLIGRQSLKALKRTTLRTFNKVLAYLNLESDVDYKYNAMDNLFQFQNGSVVFLSELADIPSDPMYDRLGSFDLTACWIDEAQQVHSEARDTLLTRLSLTSGPSWHSHPKILLTCNPKRNWLYNEFIKPYQSGTLSDEKVFIRALYTDNIYINRDQYRDTVLATNNNIKIQRLLHGSWEYDDSENNLFDYDSILQIFEPKDVRKGTYFISVDIAFHGSDLFVVVLWDGLQVIRLMTYSKTDSKEVVQIIQSLIDQYRVPERNMIYDADGIGSFMYPFFPNAFGFNNNKPSTTNYKNVKTQCYYKLAEVIKENKISISPSSKYKDQIISELNAIKRDKIDSDGKLQIISKREIKRTLGHSPDIADALMLRMAFYIDEEKYENYVPFQRRVRFG